MQYEGMKPTQNGKKEGRKRREGGWERGHEGGKKQRKSKMLNGCHLACLEAVKTGEGCGELGRKMPWIRGNDSRSL